jgi:8-oxo-dGTP pyrophosphatase MutT (NUDIX family)
MINFAQKAFITNNNKLLVIRKSAKDINQPGRWEVPGGRIAEGEDLDKHIKREVLEEAGIEIQPNDPFFLWQWRASSETGDNLQIIAVARLCTAMSTNITINGQVDGDFIDNIKWVDVMDLDTVNWIPNMIPVVDKYKSFINR